MKISYPSAWDEMSVNQGRESLNYLHLVFRNADSCGTCTNFVAHRFLGGSHSLVEKRGQHFLLFF